MKKILVFLCLFSFFGTSFANNDISFSKENKTLSVSINIPLTENKVINKQVVQYLKYTLKELQKETNNFEKLWNDWKYEINISGTKNQVNDTITYEFSNYNFTGWAHGNTITTTFNFDNDGKVINLLNQKVLDKISAYSIKYFLEEKEKWNLSSDDDWIKEWLAAKEENFKNYIIKKVDTKNLIVEFIFDQYQIAPYVEWQKTIEINLKEL